MEEMNDLIDLQNVVQADDADLVSSIIWNDVDEDVVIPCGLVNYALKTLLFGDEEALVIALTALGDVLDEDRPETCQNTVGPYIAQCGLVDVLYQRLVRCQELTTIKETLGLLFHLPDVKAIANFDQILDAYKFINVILKETHGQFSHDDVQELCIEQVRGSVIYEDQFDHLLQSDTIPTLVQYLNPIERKFMKNEVLEIFVTVTGGDNGEARVVADAGLLDTFSQMLHSEELEPDYFDEIVRILKNMTENETEVRKLCLHSDAVQQVVKFASSQDNIGRHKCLNLLDLCRYMFHPNAKDVPRWLTMDVLAFVKICFERNMCTHQAMRVLSNITVPYEGSTHEILDDMIKSNIMESMSHVYLANIDNITGLILETIHNIILSGKEDPITYFVEDDFFNFIYPLVDEDNDDKRITRKIVQLLLDTAKAGYASIVAFSSLDYRLLGLLHSDLDDLKGSVLEYCQIVANSGCENQIWGLIDCRLFQYAFDTFENSEDESYSSRVAEVLKSVVDGAVRTKIQHHLLERQKEIIEKLCLRTDFEALVTALKDVVQFCSQEEKH